MGRWSLYVKLVALMVALMLQSGFSQDSIVIRLPNPNVFVNPPVDSILKELRIWIDGKELTLWDSLEKRQMGSTSQQKLSIKIIEDPEKGVIKIIEEGEDGKVMEKEIFRIEEEKEEVDTNTSKKKSKVYKKLIVGPIKIIESYSGDEESEEESESISLWDEDEGEYEDDEGNERVEVDFLNLEFGLATWYNQKTGNLGLPSDFSPMNFSQGNSNRLGLLFLPTELKLFNRVSLNSGIQLDFYWFNFGGNSYWAIINDSLQVVTTPYSLSKSKFAFTSLGIPLGLKWEISDQDDIWIQVGGYGSYVMGMRREIEFEKEKHERKDDFLLTPLRYGIFANIGIKWIYLYVQQDLNSFFRVNYVPQMNLTSFGIGFDF